jgi:tripartite-type tricarboxylate transporter receptor subunit TctC
MAQPLSGAKILGGAKFRESEMLRLGKYVGAALATIAALGLGLPAANAQNNEKFPTKPVIMQVPFAPGGGADRTFRLFAPYLSKELGVPVKVTNVAGGGGWVSWSQVVNNWTAEDDHKLAVVNIPHIFSMLNPKMQRKETLESFNFLAWHSYDPGLWLVRWDDDRFQTLKDVIEYSKKKKLVVTVGSHGGDDHVGVGFAQKVVPAFKDWKLLFSDTGDNGKLQQILSKSSDMVAGNVGYYVRSIMERKLRPIAVLHDEPWPMLPGVPTFKEITGAANITYAGRTLATAKGVSKEKRDIYLKAIKAAINNPEYAQKEQASRNFLMFREGEEMWKLLRAGQEVAKKAAYWEQAAH